MSSFYIANPVDVAEQIALLLNTNNALLTTHTYKTILDSKTNYFVEQAAIDNKILIIGCVGIEHIDNNTTLIKHLSVIKPLQGKGVGRRLLSVALQHWKDLANMNIKHTNIASLSLARKFGFKVVDFKVVNNYFLLNVKRKNS